MLDEEVLAEFRASKALLEGHFLLSSGRHSAHYLQCARVLMDPDRAGRLAIALRHKPHAACIVPERREERTTEGGLDAAGQHNRLAPIVSRLADAGIRVSLFIAPEVRQLDAALQLGVPVVEFHTGEYAHAEGEAQAAELRRLADMAALAAKNGIEPHAGHGLTYENVQPVAAIPQLAELNIGHYLIGEAIFCGLESAVVRMREMMDAAR